MFSMQRGRLGCGNTFNVYRSLGYIRRFSGLGTLACCNGMVEPLYTLVTYIPLTF